MNQDREQLTNETRKEVLKENAAKMKQEYESQVAQLLSSVAAELDILERRQKAALADNNDEAVCLYTEAIATIKQRAAVDATNVLNSARMALVTSGLGRLIGATVGKGSGNEEEAKKYLEDVRAKMVKPGSRPGPDKPRPVEGGPPKELPKEPAPENGDD